MAADARPTMGAPRLVGRDSELAGLRQALADPPAVVLIEGEAGVGKSRLVQELIESDVGYQQALVAVCPHLRESLTLGPVVDAVREACNDPAGLGLSGLAGALRPLFPEWADQLPPAPEPVEDATASRHRMLRALAEVVGCLGARVLVLEDAHWADAATLELLLLMTSRQRAPVSLVVTYRPEEVPASSLLLRLSSRPPTGFFRWRTRLQPLDMADTAMLISSMLGGEQVSDEFTAFLQERTGGLPLAVEEVMRLLRDRVDVFHRDGGWVRRKLDDLDVPPTVRDSVLERVQRHDDDARRVLEAAAVLAEPAEDAVIAATAGLSSERAAAALGGAVRSGLLETRGWGRAAFRHVLAARAVYEVLAPQRRRDLHLRAGEALERRDAAPVGQLARHFREAGDTDRWCRYAEAAADQSSATHDHTTAVIMLSDVLDTVPLAAPTRTRLARKLAIAARRRKEPVYDLHQRVVRTLRAVLEPGDADAGEAAEVRSHLGHLLMQVGDYAAGRAELAAAVPGLGHRPATAAEAAILLAWPKAGPWPASEHMAWLQHSAELANRVRAPARRVGLMADRAVGLLLLGEESGWRLAASLPVTAPSVEERRQLTRGHLNVSTLATYWGRYAEARQHLATALELAEHDGFARLRSQGLVTETELDWLTGAWSGITGRLSSWSEADDDLAPPGQLGTQVLAGRMYAAQGQRRRAYQHFQRVLAEMQRTGISDEALVPAAALAELWLADGEVGEALSITAEPIQVVVGKHLWARASDIASARVAALVAAERVDEARDLLARFARGLRGRHAPASRAALAACRATIAERDADSHAAAAAFGRAAAAWERLPRPYDALLARERQASHLLEAGATEPGIELLSETFQGLTELGASGDAERVAHRLRGHGLNVRRRWRGGRRGYGDQLSPSELDVVRLVVAGRTTREIARALSRSPSTVATQINSARRKLRAPSRTALAVAAVDAGLDRS